ncbi:MAG TPA: lantibiotic dehydratase [Candidatus Polarisedimenticolaceae bacterium]|nr:lantibiotic dehydratase [Candidatus Polarisedimenticolaceae bacterium]
MTRLLLLRHATRPFASLEPFRGARAEAAAEALRDLEERAAVEIASLEDLLYAVAGPPSPANPARLAILAIRRDLHNRRPWTPAPLPDAIAAGLDAHAATIAALAAAEAAWSEAFARDLDAGRAAVTAACGEPLVAKALALAGRALAEKVRALATKPAASWGHGERHAASKALAYLARFATKTSPNSLFCATALANAAGDTLAHDGAPRIERLDWLLSVAEVRKIACVLAADPAVERAVLPRPNPTLREDDGSLLFWRFASARNATDDEALSRVRDHPVLRVALEEARGASLPELRERVAARCGLEPAQLAPFLRQAIERGALIGEIEIPYNERRPLRYVASRAAEAGSEAPWIGPALAIEREVDALTGVSRLGAIAAALESLPHVRPINRDELFRVDAASAARVTVPAAVLDDLRAGLRPYARLFATLYPADRYLGGWADRFLARFDADRDVELMDVYRVLTEQGDTYRPAAFPESEGASDAMRRVREHLADAARSASPGEAIPFDDEVLGRLIPDAPDPRWACGVLFQMTAAGTLFLNGLFQGAGLSLSRFAHLLGDRVIDELRRAWSVVERSGAVVAEITYNHLGRTANAGLRPSIFAHEIELPGDRASPGAHVLGLRDLVVRYDSASARFVLTRRGEATEVIPVINSGVNPVGFISFLVAIGEQGLQPIGYFPGFDVPGVVRWPRVVSGRLVLFRERWVFRHGEHPAPGSTLEAFARETLRWRRRWSLPRHVFVHSSHEPKPRYVDLASPVFLDLLRRDLAAIPEPREATLHVTEMAPGPEELWLSGHAAEVLVQMDG